MSLADSFNEIVQSRRAVRIFNQDVPYEAEIVTRSLQRAILAPTSSNMQLWEAYRVRNPAKLAELAKYCLNQKAAKTARELVVFVTRHDKWPAHAKFNLELLKQNLGEKGTEKPGSDLLKYYSHLMPFIYSQDIFGIWGGVKKLLTYLVGFAIPMPREVSLADTHVVLHKSCALAAQTFMLGVCADGYASCPMEGFDSARVKKLLQLPRAAKITMVVAVGPGTEEGIYGPRIRQPFEKVVFEV